MPVVFRAPHELADDDAAVARRVKSVSRADVAEGARRRGRTSPRTRRVAHLRGSVV